MEAEDGDYLVSELADSGTLARSIACQEPASGAITRVLPKLSSS